MQFSCSRLAAIPINFMKLSYLRPCRYGYQRSYGCLGAWIL